MATFKFINKLQGKRVIIFGGTSGIGYAVAEALVEHSANIIITGSNTGRLQTTIQRLTASYPHVEESQISIQLCDLSNTDALEDNLRDLFKAASENGSKKIDHIVFSAGNHFDVAGGITGTDMNVIKDIMSVRAYGPIFVAKIIAKTDYVNKSDSSSFTFTAGTAHTRPRPTWSIVSMLSGGLVGLARGLALDLAPVRVNVVQPGNVHTELYERAGPAAIEVTRKSTLLKKLGQPEDVAEAYLYFMKDTAADGTFIISDSGRLLA
jgi:NAD(P)-dependent dehydrogenase (short-subunit alcohol dehydrogenase family)